MKKIPNVLTVFRLCIVPFFAFYLWKEQYTIAFILFAIAAFTDVLDGFLARKYNAISNFGKICDPLADKALQLSALVVLYLISKLNIIFVIILFTKELLLIIGGILLFKRDLIVPSKWYGKASSTLLNTSIAISIIFKISNIYINIIIGFSIAFTIFALFKYCSNYLEIYKLSFDNKKLS